MAKPKTYSGSLVAIYLEGAVAGQFTRPCGLTQHSVSFTKNMNEVDVPDCDDPDLPAWIEREVSSLDFSGNGSGVLAVGAVDTWWEAFESKESIPARVYIGKPDDVQNGRYWAGNIHVSSFEVTGNKGEKAQVSIAFASDGEMTFHNITAP
ncbi:phage tail tube protein [Paracoccus aminophilus]|uniref:Phage major tail protein n=1 Tax=Paracoccus aminophilus JCM 7686 TaxID=1367847 RepID=S5XM48_PARAH|nr:phage tail tube protein [Paracoccus aminophilus]AGT08349.1 phage major tail protein [Paracoccus aminophilus JCM 7686]